MKITNPTSGQTVCLWTDKQREYLTTDRSGFNVEDFYYLDLKNQQKDDDSKSGFLCFKWDAPVSATLEISEDESFSSPICFFGEGEALVDNLKIGTKYYARVVAEGEVSETVEFYTERSYPRFISVDGISNVRDVGGAINRDGKEVRQGLLYRGSEMNSHKTITESGLKTMREVLKINTEIDLRNSTEQLMDVYRGNYVNISIPAYRNLLTRPELNKQLIELLADAGNYPIYMHCWGGADRTESFIFLIEILLGMEIKDTVDAYEATSLSTFGARSVNKELYVNFLSTIGLFVGEDIYEKVYNYFIFAGVAPETIEKVREIFLK